MKKLLATFLAISGLAVAIATSAKAETTECTEIVALPAVITVQGVYCFKQKLGTSITSGNAITINTNNVTIDFNNFKLGGLSAGPTTAAIGVYGLNRQNIILRNGNIRGFRFGIFLEQQSGTSSGHVIENNLADGNTFGGIRVDGSNTVVRNNNINNTNASSSGSTVQAITIINGSNTVVSGNTVAGGVTNGATFSSAIGIYIGSSSIVEVIDNAVFDLNTADFLYGIFLSVATNVTIKDNRIVNDSGGTTAIYGPGGLTTGVDCIGNVVRGYTTGSDGCDYLSGNHIN